MAQDSKNEQGESDDKEGFVVNDKRRFDTEGNTKSEEVQPETADSNQPTPKEDEFVMKEGASETDAPPQPDFSAFILSLATQTLVQLGEMPAPAGVDIPVNVAVAKQTIDLLSMLSEKTKGNLTESEDKLLEEILHNLRMSYVSKTQ